MQGKACCNAVPPQTASVQLSENANADVEKGRPSRSRGQDCPLASMPLRTRRSDKERTLAPAGGGVHSRLECTLAHFRFMW